MVEGTNGVAEAALYSQERRMADDKPTVEEQRTNPSPWEKARELADILVAWGFDLSEAAGFQPVGDDVDSQAHSILKDSFQRLQEQLQADGLI